MFLYCSKNMRLSITTNNYFAERFVIHRDSHKQRVGNVPQNVCNIEGQTNVSRELTESETLKKKELKSLEELDSNLITGVVLEMVNNCTPQSSTKVLVHMHDLQCFFFAGFSVSFTLFSPSRGHRER